MYAIVEVKGKQYKAVEGETIRVDKISMEAGESFDVESIMLLSKDEDVTVGTPFVKGAKVSFTIKGSQRSKKIRVVKFKRRKGYERNHGHRQDYTLLTVNSIKS